MELRVDFFGNFTASLNDVTIDLEKLLGRQLSSLFALLVYNYGKVVTKERLYTVLWQDSENPANALKYAIFRLRNALNEIEEFKAVELIETLKNGYQINNAVEIIADYNLYKKAVQKALITQEIEDYKAALAYYKGDFLQNLDNEFIYLERAHYKISMVDLAEVMCNKCLELKEYRLCLDTCNFALRYDSYNEELIYCYIKALIDTKQYNQALKYYDNASKMLYKELGLGLQEKTNSLFKVISKEEKAEKQDIDTFSEGLYDITQLKGPMYCEYQIFKMITQYGVRTMIRNRIKKYMIFIDFVNDIYDMDALIDIVSQTLRIDDVFTKVSYTQLAILCDLRDISDAYIVGEKIISKYYRKVDNRARLMYKPKVLTDEKKDKETKQGSLFVLK